MKIECECGNSQKANLKGYDIPVGATILKSTMCPECEDEHEGDYYEEYFENAQGVNLGKAS